MILSDVMDEIATRLDTIAGLRVYGHPPDEIQAPAGVVSYPEVDFDGAYARGMDRYQLPVIIAVGKVWTRSARDQLSAYMNGSGVTSVKAALESGTYTAFHTLRVTRIAVDPIMIGSVEYLAATFTLDITGVGT